MRTGGMICLFDVALPLTWSLPPCFCRRQKTPEPKTVHGFQRVTSGATIPGPCADPTKKAKTKNTPSRLAHGRGTEIKLDRRSPSFARGVLPAGGVRGLMVRIRPKKAKHPAATKMLTGMDYRLGSGEARYARGSFFLVGGGGCGPSTP